MVANTERRQTTSSQCVTVRHNLIRRFGIPPFLSGNNRSALYIPENFIIPYQAHTHRIVSLGALNEASICLLPHALNTRIRDKLLILFVRKPIRDGDIILAAIETRVLQTCQ